MYTNFRDEADDFKNKNTSSEEQRQEELASPRWQKWDVQTLSKAASSAKAGDSIHVFIGLALLDGSNRSWRGFRETKLTSTTTHKTCP
jgi:hypothetical protein